MLGNPVIEIVPGWQTNACVLAACRVGSPSWGQKQGCCYCFQGVKEHSDSVFPPSSSLQFALNILNFFISVEFSTSLLIFGTEEFLVVGACPVHYRTCSSILRLCALGDRSTYPTRSCDNQECPRRCQTFSRGQNCP